MCVYGDSTVTGSVGQQQQLLLVAKEGDRQPVGAAPASGSIVVLLGSHRPVDIICQDDVWGQADGAAVRVLNLGAAAA